VLAISRELGAQRAVGLSESERAAVGLSGVPPWPRPARQPDPPPGPVRVDDIPSLPPGRGQLPARPPRTRTLLGSPSASAARSMATCTCPNAATDGPSTAPPRTSSSLWPGRPASPPTTPACSHRSVLALSSSSGCCCRPCPTCARSLAPPSTGPPPLPPTWATTGTAPSSYPTPRRFPHRGSPPDAAHKVSNR
jgi:hypothetical protein